MSEAETVNERDAAALRPSRVRIQSDPDAGAWRIQAGEHRVSGRAPSLGGNEKSGFRAAELLLGALGLCMTDIAMAFCRARGFAVRGITTELEDHGALDPLRIDAIKAVMHIDGTLTPEQTARVISAVAKHCKIKNTLAGNPAVDVVVRPASSGLAAAPATQADGDIRCAC